MFRDISSEILAPSCICLKLLLVRGQKGSWYTGQQNMGLACGVDSEIPLHLICQGAMSYPSGSVWLILVLGGTVMCGQNFRKTEGQIWCEVRSQFLAIHSLDCSNSQQALFKELHCHQEPRFADLPNGAKSYLTNHSVPTCSWNEVDSVLKGEWFCLKGLSWSLAHSTQKRFCKSQQLLWKQQHRFMKNVMTIGITE